MAQPGRIYISTCRNEQYRERTTRIIQTYRHLVWKLNKTRVEQIILSGMLPVMEGREATYRNGKINVLLEQMCEEAGVGFKYF